MGSGFSKMKKQAKMLGEQFNKAQEQMKTMEVEGQAGNGLVRVKLNGEKSLLKISINPECVDPSDVESPTKNHGPDLRLRPDLSLTASACCCQHSSHSQYQS